MRVLVIASEVPPVVSGVARSVSQLVDGLAGRGHEVDVLCAADAPYLARGDFRISSLAARLPQVVRDLDRYDIVNVHGPAPTISETFLAAIGLARRGRRPGLVYTHHFTIEFGQRWIQPLTRSYDRASHELGRLADHVVVTSDSYFDILSLRAGEAKTTVIPWGVDLERFSVGPSDPYGGGRDLRVLYVGQLREYKGSHVALEAIANLAGVSLTIVGRGPNEDALRRRLARRDAGNVVLRGYLSDEDLIEEYARHDVVLLPSVNRMEAYGIVLIEGMASGCVPVASDLPGVRDVARGCGMLAAPDDAADLRWAIALLAARPDLVATFRVRAIEKSAGYSHHATIERYERTFEAVVGGLSDVRSAS